MKQLLYLTIIILASCNSGGTIEHTYLEYRNDKTGQQKFKIDNYRLNTSNNLEYFSVLKSDSNVLRNWIFPNPKSMIGTTLEFGESESPYKSTLIDKRYLVIEGKKHEVIKYNIDQLLSIDEESNKIYVEGFGVIIETFWRKNKIQVIEMNSALDQNTTLQLMIDELLEDEDFIWSQKNKFQ